MKNNVVYRCDKTVNHIRDITSERSDISLGWNRIKSSKKIHRADATCFSEQIFTKYYRKSRPLRETARRNNSRRVCPVNAHAYKMPQLCRAAFARVATDNMRRRVGVRITEIIAFALQGARSRRNKSCSLRGELLGCKQTIDSSHLPLTSACWEWETRVCEWHRLQANCKTRKFPRRFIKSPFQVCIAPINSNTDFFF